MKTALPRPQYIVKRSASQRQQRLRHRMSCGTSQDTRRLKNHSTDDGFDDDVIMT